ncbi:MAG: heparinase II/III family protein [Micavibrio aeruginosavorus]|uniref:Heparinase II/III family protein n=1 Tax=Micavibrio aeruginosavorus TaxID=349221 RepID=A0A7T5R371_9BACT|nr:MAG: heparinase II/III family protein [Micavibrio aeruginosavorus]
MVARVPALRHLRQKASHAAFNTAFYNWTLGNDSSHDLIVRPVDPWPGNPALGRGLCGGAFVLEGQEKQVGRRLWEPSQLSLAWLNHLHGFEWLRDLRSLGGDQGRAQARDLISDWMNRFSGWDASAWQPDITGLRVANWIMLYEFFGASADEEFQDRFFLALLRQSRHLARALPGTLHGLPLLQGIRGLILAGLAVSGHESWLIQGLDLLESETDKQILSDGGHISRSPAVLLEVLRVYVDVRIALRAGGYPVPEQIEHTIDRMAQAMRFFRHADKKLTTFHGTQELDSVYADTILAHANARGRILRNLPHSDYERVTLGRSVMTMDVGSPPPWPYDNVAHASPLAFEFIYGKERIFVSCGTHPMDDDWRNVLRGTAAHNTIMLDDRNSCEIKSDGHMGRRPRTVSSTREEGLYATLIDAVHDGYVPVNGITHRRRLYLGDQGHDLRGEENLTCTVGLTRLAVVTARFHLHPKVQVSLIREGEEALLRLPGGSGWRFYFTGGTLSLENSVYFGEGCEMRKTKQLVISAAMETDTLQLKWALQREGV